jgi:hypothetical protein
LIALLAAAVLLPSSAEAALSLEETAGLRALLEKAGTRAPSLAPEPVGSLLRQRVGVDLLAEPPGWGLSARGARLLVFSREAMGLIAPVRDAKAARKMMAAWLAEDKRRLARIAGGRLLTASGRGSQALFAGMARGVPLPRELAARARGPVWLWARLQDPLRAAVLSIDASGIGMVARGLVTSGLPLLAGRAPFGCAQAIACLRAGVAEGGRQAIAQLLERLGVPPQPELAGADRVEERLDAIDVRALSDQRSLARALRITPVFGGAESAAPALDALVDLARLDAALAGMTALDAVRGGFAAGTYAARAVYGDLLRNAGPLTIAGSPARGNAAEIEIRLPLR